MLSWTESSVFYTHFCPLELSRLFAGQNQLRHSSMPDEMIYRMLNAGFICVKGGLLARDRFVFLSQINQVRNGEVYLNASADDLIRA